MPGRQGRNQKLGDLGKRAQAGGVEGSSPSPSHFERIKKRPCQPNCRQGRVRRPQLTRVAHDAGSPDPHMCRQIVKCLPLLYFSFAKKAKSSGAKKFNRPTHRCISSRRLGLSLSEHRHALCNTALQIGVKPAACGWKNSFSKNNRPIARADTLPNQGSLEWLPSQNGGFLECLQPHQATVFASAISAFTGKKPVPL